MLQQKIFVSILTIFLVSFFQATHESPITNPLKEHGDIGSIVPEYLDVKKFKTFHNSTPIVLTNVPHIQLSSSEKSCAIDFRLRWSTSVGSSVYAPPVIFPVGNDGKKGIFLSTFYEFIEVLGYDGFKPWGWPISFEGSSFQGSPMLYDIDGDGATDIGVVDRDANLYWVRLGEFGQYLEDYHTKVPKLKVKKDWADGLDPKFVDSYVMLSMFDHSGEENGSGGSNAEKTKPRAKQDKLGVPVKQETYNGIKRDKAKSGSGKSSGNSGKDNSSVSGGKSGDGRGNGSGGGGKPHGGGGGSRRRLMQNHKDDHITEKNVNTTTSTTTADKTTDAKNIPLQPQQHQNNHNDHNDHNDHGLDEHHEASKDSPSNGDRGDPESLHSPMDDDHSFHGEFHNRHNNNSNNTTGDGDGDGDGEGDLTDDFNGKGAYMYGVPARGGYLMDDVHPYYFNMQNDSQFVFIDAHVLGSPVLADVNNDGHLEVIMAISYYFDKAEYAGKTLDFDPSLYVAGGIVCWDMDLQDWSWMVHLDLTTDKTKYKALIHSSPTVVDMDGDGRHEVIIGTALGLLYVID
eukprot:gene8593-17722_t